jgi:putative two-component system response regulator
MKIIEDGFPVLAQGLPILVVDDEAPIRRLLTRALENEGFVCLPASSAAEAKLLLQETTFALVLSDVNMPGESGIDLVKHMVVAYPDTAVVMCTVLDDPNIANLVLEIGAYGYVAKPFDANEVLIAVVNALRRRALVMENTGHRLRLEEMVEARTQSLQSAVSDLEHAEAEIRLSRDETIQRLSAAAEYRDFDTARHVKRMSLYCAFLAEKLGADPERCETIRLASAMHDVGKIGIPDHILLKKGSLSADEWRIMKSHTEIGYHILSNSHSDVMNEAATIALTHHERIDGSGYPRGLVEDEIPLLGRIAAVADVFDALTSHRVYRKDLSLGEALETMREGRGAQFDPIVLDPFLESIDGVLAIKDRNPDHELIALKRGA